MHAIQESFTVNRLAIDGDSSNAPQIVNPHIIRKIHDHRMAAADTVLVKGNVIALKMPPRNEGILKRIDIVIAAINFAVSQLQLQD